MGARTREAAAKVGLVVTLATQRKNEGEFAIEVPAREAECKFVELTPYLYLDRLAQRTYNIRWAPTRTAIMSKLQDIGRRFEPFWHRLTCGRRARSLMRISSSCDGSTVQWAEYGINDRGKGSWDSFCSCCKRPLSIELAGPSQPATQRRKVENYAYACALWGRDPQHILGAMVLGFSLRRTGTRKDMVLMHTADVPEEALALLKRSGWRLHKVSYVHACEQMFAKPHNRFAGVFNKLRVFGLIEYSKVLLLDSDLLVQENIDHLFDLRAPAAMHRGVGCGYNHGEKIDGTCFFGGARPDFDLTSIDWSASSDWANVKGPWSWGQAGGINAGVMLLRPDLETLKQTLLEVGDGSHPEHIRGGGPEQDYLSRFFANEWTHISVAYNFQIHQMYFLLGDFAAKDSKASRREFIKNPELIKIYHYSSDPKPWARRLDAEFSSLSEGEWLKEWLGRFGGYRQWVLEDPEYKEEINDVVPQPPAWAIQALEDVAKLSIGSWDGAYQGLADELLEPDLAQAVVNAVSWQVDVLSSTSDSERSVA